MCACVSTRVCVLNKDALTTTAVHHNLRVGVHEELVRVQGERRPPRQHRGQLQLLKPRGVLSVGRHAHQEVYRRTVQRRQDVDERTEREFRATYGKRRPVGYDFADL